TKQPAPRPTRRIDVSRSSEISSAQQRYKHLGFKAGSYVYCGTGIDQVEANQNRCQRTPIYTHSPNDQQHHSQGGQDRNNSKNEPRQPRIDTRLDSRRDKQNKKKTGKTYNTITLF